MCVKDMKVNDNEELKTCPFCGADAFVWGMNRRYKVSCSNDCISMPPMVDMWFTSEQEATKQWNKRVNVKDN